eukprot:300315-Chlamydomonas_euryale.AAC.1
MSACVKGQEGGTTCIAKRACPSVEHGACCNRAISLQCPVVIIQHGGQQNATNHILEMHPDHIPHNKTCRQKGSNLPPFAC